MNYTRIKNALLARKAMFNFSNRRGSKLKVVSVFVLYIIFEFGPNVTCTAIHTTLLYIRRGAHADDLKRYLEELYALGLIDHKTGNRKRYFITVAGRQLLDNFEKTYRNLRIDKHHTSIKKINSHAKKAKV